MTHIRSLRPINFLTAAFMAFSAPPTVQAETYPSKPITFIVPFGAGGTADVIARVLAEQVGASLGQAVVVDNRTGADGTIGAHAVVRALPDGYTLLQASTSHAILPSLRSDLPYDWQRDLVPVFGISTVPQAIAVSGKSEIRSMADLAASAKSFSGGANYSSGGAGSISHLTAAFVAQELKMSVVHVPYRGLSNAVQAVLSQEVQFTVVNIPDVIQLTKAGSLRLLAVTSERRVPQLPDVPTLVEQGFGGWTSSSWSAYLVPAKTPPDVIERLQRAFLVAAAEPKVKERLDPIGVSLQPMVGRDLGTFLQNESTRWRKVIEANQITLKN